MVAMQTRSYPNGKADGLRLFHAIREQTEAGRFDDTFLEKIVEYHTMYPRSEKFDVFYAQYAIAHEAYDVALESLEKAYKNRKINLIIWKLLIQCYEAWGRTSRMLFFRGLCNRFYALPIEIQLPREQMSEHLGVLSLALGAANYAPLAENSMKIDENGVTQKHSSTFSGNRPIPCLVPTEAEPYWSGVYIEQESLDGLGWLLSTVRDEENFLKYGGTGITFDIMRAQKTKEFSLDENGEKCIVPVAGTEPRQQVDFSTASFSDSAYVGQWHYSFFRLEQPTQISSEAPFIIGRPIRLGHNPKRKKVILRILVDGLCWREMIRTQYRYVPNIMNFFSKGVIFNSHFSVTEYTYTSLPTIETGLYPEHSQIFNLKAYCELDAEYTTISEKMRTLGYYCANIMSGVDGIYNGSTRGYERLIVNPYALPTYVGVERAIQQMEAFADCDQFLFVHTMDTHPWSADSFPIPLRTQTQLSLKERLEGATTEAASVYLPNLPLYTNANLYGIMNADRALGELFRYMETHYDENEYILQLYSDHGVPIYDKHPYILSENQVGAALMMRGAGIPARGAVDELTSAIDIYPITSHLAGAPTEDWLDGNLPAVFGGTERDHVISESIYPGQTYKLCIRTKEHECRLESNEPVDEDGTVDLSGARMALFTRTEKPVPVEDEALWQKFTAIVKEHTASFNNEGHYWPEMREARPLWFEQKIEERTDEFTAFAFAPVVRTE